jgi:DNA-binding IclR family transcriptional regulator
LPISAEQKAVGALGSVDNALRLLLLLQGQPEVRLSDAAVALSVANSTAHRLLATLAARGFVVQGSSRAYRLGPAFAGRPGPGLPEDLLPVVRERLGTLCEQVGETCHFLVLEGNGSRFLAGVEAPRALRVGARTGMLLPAHANSGGKALLAQLCEAELEALYPRGLPAVATRRAVRDLDGLRRELLLTRRRGYGTNVDESELGISAVGRQLHGPDGRVLGALAIAAPSARCSPPRLRALAELLLNEVASTERYLSAGGLGGLERG